MSGPDERSRHEADEQAHEQAGHRHHDECYACPVGGLFLTARGGSPEAVEHLVNAASELVAAMRSVLEAAESFIEQQKGGAQSSPSSASSSRLQRIDVSGDDEAG